MMRVTDFMVSKDSAPLPLVFILLFYSGTVIALQSVFPVMRIFHPQTIFSGIAIILAVVFLFIGNNTLNFDRIQKYFAVYCILATVGLYRSSEAGCLTLGMESVSILWKQLVFLVIIISFTRTLLVLVFVQQWILITVALFVLHSTKAIFAGYTGAGERFDNYVGLISNADYIGIFTAIFVVIFLHVALHAQKVIKRLFWAVLSVFSLIIMIKTQTRAAVVVLGVLVPCWMFIASSSKIEIFQKAVVLLLSIGTVFIIGSLTGTNYGSYFDRISTITRYASDEADFNTKSRFFMWNQGIAIGMANPLLGVGSGATAPHLELNFEGVELKSKAGTAEGFSIHNTFIQIFAERGLAGLVPFCLMLLYAYMNNNAVARFARRQPEKRQLAILADVGRLYLVGYVVGAMFISIDYDWTLFAFLAQAVSSRRYIQENSGRESC